MKRVVLVLSLILLFSSSLFASMTFYVKEAPFYVYDTNVFSDPFVQYADESFLQWAQNHPYLKRHSAGTYTEFDFLFKENARVGLSTAINFGWPIIAETYVPDGDLSGDWEYKKEDAFSIQDVSMFVSIGPLFRVAFGIMEAGVAVRLSFGSYESFINDLVLGVQIDPYLNIFVQNGFFLTVGVHYDAHLFLFFLHDPVSIYQDNYVMMGIGGYVGVGFAFGNREDTK